MQRKYIQNIIHNNLIENIYLILMSDFGVRISNELIEIRKFSLYFCLPAPTRLSPCSPLCSLLPAPDPSALSYSPCSQLPFQLSAPSFMATAKKVVTKGKYVLRQLILIRVIGHQISSLEVHLKDFVSDLQNNI